MKDNPLLTALGNQPAERIGAVVKKETDEIKQALASLKASAEAGAQGHIVALGRIEERVGAIEKFLKINGGAVPAERHPA